MPAKHRLRFSLLRLLPAVLFLAACTAPLGPGYTIEKQSLDAHYFASDPLRFEIHARFRLKNTGNRSLSSLNVRLPGQKEYGRKNLRATIDGAAASLSPAADGNEMQVIFPRAWAPRDVHEIVLDYELAGPSAPSQGIALTSESLFLAGACWYPVLLPPKALFGKGGDRRKPLEMTLRVPEGFLAQSSGRARGVHKENAELVYRFRIGKEDSDPFILAGRFFEQRFQSAATTVIFWTPGGPLTPDQLARAGGNFAATLEEYEKNYGALGKKKEPYWVVGMKEWPSAQEGEYPVAGTPNFPRGAVLPVVSDNSDKAVNANLVLGDYALAQSWLGGAAGAGSSPGATFSEGLCIYASRFIAHQVPGWETDRKGEMKKALLLYDAQLPNKGRSLLAMTEGRTAEEKHYALAKAGMFLIALEDRCGPDNLQHALRHLAQSLRGSNYSYDELRSALEQECHQDLGPMFREWLTETGIPADFRARYGAKP
jgi:hypothetical protein